MTTQPEYGEEERVRQQVESEQPPDYGGHEREVRTREREDAEVEYLDPESNEAHAPGQVCERCGRVITAGQDVRLRADGHWVHEVCPPDLGGLPADGTESAGGA
jgi:hypothetical protein